MTTSLNSFTGDDVVYGDNGNDSIILGDGNDYAIGGEGIDTIYGNEGNDIAFGSNGNDILFGNEGNDQLHGEAGVDTIQGNEGIDAIFGGLENDLLDGGSEADSIFGESGNDFIFGRAGADSLFGGDGDDMIFGDVGADFIDGGIGNNAIDAGDGNDTVITYEGNDNILLGAGNDSANAGAGDDFVQGSDGDDVINLGLGHDTALGGAGNDIIRGQDGDDNLQGGDGNDKLIGGLGTNRLFGDAGRDGLIGGAGGFTFMNGGLGDDRFLVFTTDIIIDVASEDALLRFVNVSNQWTTDEMEQVDIGIGRLHGFINNSRLLKDSITSVPLIFEKHFSLGGGVATVNTYQNGNTLNYSLVGRDWFSSIDNFRVLKYADWNENDAGAAKARETETYRVIGHNWNSTEEIANLLPSRQYLWNEFLNASSWTQLNPFDFTNFAPLTTRIGITCDWLTLREISRRPILSKNWSTIWEIKFDDALQSQRRNFTSKISIVDSLLVGLNSL